MPFDCTPTPTKTQTLIDRAIELLGERGWCQNMSRDRFGRMCLVGSLLIAAKEMGEHDGFAFDALRPIKIHEWTNWNDRPGRTKDQVVEKLRELRTGTMERSSEFWTPNMVISSKDLANELVFTVMTDAPF